MHKNLFLNRAPDSTDPDPESAGDSVICEPFHATGIHECLDHAKSNKKNFTVRAWTPGYGTRQKNCREKSLAMGHTLVTVKARISENFSLEKTDYTQTLNLLQLQISPEELLVRLAASLRDPDSGKHEKFSLNSVPQ